MITSVFLGKNTRKSIREALNSHSLVAAIIPLGSTEQHNEHLAMEQDAAGAEYLAARVAKKLFPKMVVTPTINIGSSPHHMQHPGTLTLENDTLLLVLKDIVNSLQQHGINNIFVLNGHGGNVRALEGKLETITNTENLNFHFISYWDVLDREYIEKILGEAIVPGHAGVFETSFALSAFPENVDMSAKYPDHFKDKNDFERDYLLFEESRGSSVQHGNKCIAHIVDRLTDKIESCFQS